MKWLTVNQRYHAGSYLPPASQVKCFHLEDLDQPLAGRELNAITAAAKRFMISADFGLYACAGEHQARNWVRCCPHFICHNYVYIGVNRKYPFIEQCLEFSSTNQTPRT